MKHSVGGGVAMQRVGVQSEGAPRLAFAVRGLVIAVSILVGLLFAATVSAEAAGDAADSRGLTVFREHLRELLAHRCATCHGAGTVESDFDMSTRDRLLAGGASGPAVVPGSHQQSLLFRLAARLEEPHMPEEGDALSSQELAWLAEWIDCGAPYDRPLIEESDRGPWTKRTVAAEARQFWSFQPLAAVEPPRVADPESWCRNAIDRFILEKQLTAGLVPSPEAPVQTLRRRLSLDLTGLPATPEEIAGLVADASDEAYERHVEDLLGRPAFGERWAQHWLDVARFAESFGYEQDYDRPHAHHYRDFVVRAFNEDLPFDTFLEWQLAGDELAPDNLEAQKATGFLAAGAFPTQLTEKEFESARYGELDDMVATVGTAMLGLTIGCARCHDHKFDPFPQADYYRLAATFTTTIRSNVDLHVDPGKHRAEIAAWQGRLEAARAAREAFARDELPRRFDAWAEAWRSAHSSAVKAAAGDAAASDWRLGRIVSAESRSGGPFAELADGSLLAGGEAGDRDVYTIVLDTPLDTVASLRLDALADPSLPRGGPGRAGHGNFALSNLTVAAGPIPAEGKAAAKPTPVALINPRADFAQTKPDLAVAYAIDEDEITAWAIDPEVGRSHVAAFDLEKPVTHKGGVRLTVTLAFMNNRRHAIGRPRVSVAGSAGLAVEPVTAAHDPVDAHRESRRRVSELLAKPAGERNAAEQQELALLHRIFDPDAERLEIEVRRLESEKPRPDLLRVLVASENVPHIPHHADGRGYPHFYPETHFLRRGDVNQKEGVAEAGYLQVLTRTADGLDPWRQPPPEEATTSHRRAALARWITDVERGGGSLAARVIVNRLWQHHFGEGLVATPSDFGKQGDPPSHSELLDYLARELIRGGWRLKPIHRLIVTSATYRQTSDIDAAKAGVDPANRLLWRYNRRRLDGESIRDTLLALAGGLDPQLGGRAGRDETSPRRSLYLERKRSKLPLFLRTFDAPDYVSGLAKRSITTTAPQALAMMNGPSVRSWAERFAQRMIEGADRVPQLPPPRGQPAAHAETAEAAVLRAAYATALGRSPTPTELHDATLFLRTQHAAYAAAGTGNPALAATADVCQVLLGLNETLHIE